MKLSIKNFAKIKEAEITIDGITVITGENNTGKSTVGKILFSWFNALSDVEEKILQKRLKEIERANKALIQDYISDAWVTRSMQVQSAAVLARKINMQIRKELDRNLSLTEENLLNMVAKLIKKWGESTEGIEPYTYLDMLEDICNTIQEVMELPEENIVLEIISRYFNQVFHSQITSFAEDIHGETMLVLEMKGKEQKLFFDSDSCKAFANHIRIFQKAIYIDNPFAVDELSGYRDLNPMDKMLRDLLTSKAQEDVLDEVIGAVRAKEKLGDFYEILQSVVDGEIVINQSNEEYYLKNQESNEPISFRNLSTGMKSFVILKMLLEKGELKEKDVLILDEPEIHLHPQWQIAYAELIVLLQKHFDLSVVITTHSPYFMDAIHLFSCKYGSESRVNYYASSKVGNLVKMDCVTGNLEEIYQKMAAPIQMLDSLRYELNNR
ncbi:MAG: AAA family ATPase [Lachnospiraceae bacterium]|nr:AAA family ATPase [Lachnospiraceae bacterium]